MDASFYLEDEAATARAGSAKAEALRGLASEIERDGFVIGLSGDLGAGKTAWVRATLRALGTTGPVRSPSFSLLEVYVVSRLNFYHFDFYRFKEPSEFATAGFRELFGPGSICAIEWPQHAKGLLPSLDLSVALSARSSGRQADLAAMSTLGELCLNRMSAQLSDLAIRNADA